MSDFRLQALKKAGESDFASPVSAFEAQIQADHSKYLKLLELFFVQMKNEEVEADKAERIIEQLIGYFEEEAAQVEEVCAAIGGLEELDRAWADQTERGINALDDAAFHYLEGGNLSLLDECFEQVEKALIDRLPYHSRFQAALASCAA